MAMATSVLSSARLAAEWDAWPHIRPFGFGISRAEQPLREWICGVPGPKFSDWEGGYFRVVIKFPSNYPKSPPKCYFNPPIFHPNVSPQSGRIALSSTSDRDWIPQTTIKPILLGIQQLLDSPCVQDLTNAEAYAAFTFCNEEFSRRAQEHATQAQPPSNYPLYKTVARKESGGTTRATKTASSFSHCPSTAPSPTTNAKPVTASPFSLGPSTAPSPTTNAKSVTASSFSLGPSTARTTAPTVTAPLFASTAPSPFDTTTAKPVTSPAFSLGTSTAPSPFSTQTAKPIPTPLGTSTAPSLFGSTTPAFSLDPFTAPSPFGTQTAKPVTTPAFSLGPSTAPTTAATVTAPLGTSNVPSLFGSTTPAFSLGNSTAPSPFGTQAAKPVTTPAFLLGTSTAPSPFSTTASPFSLGTGPTASPLGSVAAVVEFDAPSEMNALLKHHTEYGAEYNKLKQTPECTSVFKTINKTLRSTFKKDKEESISKSILQHLESCEGDVLKFALIFVASKLMTQVASREVATYVGVSYNKIHTFVKDKKGVSSAGTFETMCHSYLANRSDLVVPYNGPTSGFVQMNDKSEIETKVEEIRATLRLFTSTIMKNNPSKGLEWFRNMLNKNTKADGAFDAALLGFFEACDTELLSHGFNELIPGIESRVTNSLTATMADSPSKDASVKANTELLETISKVK